MSIGFKALLVFTVACTLAAAVFGFGSEVLAFRASFEGDDARAQLVLLARLAVFVTLGAVVAFRGGWPGIPAALAMVLGATAVEWAMFPFAYEFAQSQSSLPDGFPDTATRPDYVAWAVGDVLGVGFAAAVTQGMRLLVGSIPRRSRDE